MRVKLALLCDKKISVKLDDKEISILPAKRECTIEELERAINEMVQAIDGDWE